MRKKKCVTNGTTFTDIEPVKKERYYKYHKVVLSVIFLLFIQIVSAYPSLMYNKNRVSYEDLDRFRSIMSTIPEDYFNGIEVITIRNRPHHLYDFDAWFQYKAYRTYITIYNFKYLEDYEVYNIMLHELGHKVEFDILKLNTSIAKITLSEAFAEAWRKEHGGDERCYSSDRTIC